MLTFINSIDLYVVTVFAANRSVESAKFWFWLTSWGDKWTVAFLSAAIALALFLFHRPQGRVFSSLFPPQQKHLLWQDLTALVIAVGGATGSVYLLKELVERARPDRIFAAVPEIGFSFPSGHATLAVALYGILIYLFHKYLPAGKWRAVILPFLGVFALSIAISRVILGVHYPSDVIAGLILGVVWLWVGIKISKAKVGPGQGLTFRERFALLKERPSPDHDDGGKTLGR